MFNSEQKEKFLTERAKTTSTRYGYIKFFEAIAPYEEDWGVDMCCQDDKDKLLGAMSDLIGPRGGKKSSRFRLAASYCQWCVDNGVKNARNYLKGSVDLTLGKFKRKTVASPKHLQAYLDSLFDPESAGTRDLIYRAYYWLAYIGINKEDIDKITVDDLDMGQRCIRFKGKEYGFPLESMATFSQCFKLKSLASQDGKFSIPREGNALLRGDASYTARGIETRIQRMNDKHADESLDLEDELLYSFVRDSGAFYRAYQAENDGEKPDFSLVIKGDIKDVDALTDDEFSKKWKGRETVYRRNYKRWKKAHNLD